MFENEEIVGAVGSLVNPPDYVKPLISDPQTKGFESFRRTGLYPINHTVVIHLDTISQHPDLPKQLFEALSLSKKNYLENLDESPEASKEDKLTASLRNAINGDPFPYGVKKNRQALETLCRQARLQHITKEHFKIKDIIEPTTLLLDE